jgi:ABC-2 type transport system permease protein
MMIAMFPTMQKANIEQLLENYPEDMLKFFGGEGAIAMSKIEGFLSMEFLSFFFILILVFYVGSTAGSTIAGYIEKKTIGFELSQPISRTVFVLSQAIVSLFYIALLTVATSFSIWVLCKGYDVSIKNNGLVAFTVIATLFLTAHYGIAIFLSSIFKTKLSVVLSVVSLSVFFFVFSSLSNIVEKLKYYNKLSLYHLYNPQKLLESGNININHVLILAGITLVGILGAMAIFNRKDLP